ncbi:MAG: hypothetical protein FWD97_00430 [Defluviitaleaceae bacterium]|nr:hypothetical protein [Defluviitaleaceae bacterium]
MVIFRCFNFGKQCIVGLSSLDTRLLGLRPKPQNRKHSLRSAFKKQSFACGLLSEVQDQIPRQKCKTKDHDGN